MSGLLLTACSQKSYSLLSSEAQPSPGSTLYWIDNDHVIFAGFERGEGRASEGEAVFVWDTKTNEIKKLIERRSLDGSTITSSSTYGNLCYADGFVRYSYSEGEFPHWINLAIEGKIGETRLVQLPEQKPFKVFFNRFTCQDYDERELQNNGDGVRRIPLRREHGILEAGREGRTGLDVALRLVPNQGQPVELAVKDWQVDYARTTYIGFLGAYLFYGSRLTRNPEDEETLRIDTPHPIYLVKPSGETKTISVPHPNAGRGEKRYYVTGAGVVLTAGRGYLSGLFTGSAATFFLRNGSKSVTRLFPGTAEAASVSPDGCRLAFAHDDKVYTTPNPAKVLTFC